MTIKKVFLFLPPFLTTSPHQNVAGHKKLKRKIATEFLPSPPLPLALLFFTLRFRWLGYNATNFLGHKDLEIIDVALWSFKYLDF